jgi:phosphate transport system substrate-binding protein
MTYDARVSTGQNKPKGFDLIRNRLLGLIIATVGTVACMAAVSTASAFAELKGAGSTLVAPLMANWINGFEAHENGAITASYSSVGSGTGIADITARTVDFGASDAPLTPEQAGKCGSCVQIPWALTATGVAYDIPGVKHDKLHLSGPVIAEIYLGKITKWNSPKIKKLNPKLHLPGLKITPVFRSDGSGDTYAFTNYLSKINSTWKSSIGYATSVAFPTADGAVGAKGNSGVTSVVDTTKGAIGYISASYIVAAGLQAAAVQNAAGNFEYPSIPNIEDAAQTVKHVPANNELHIVDPSKKAKIAYPISTFTYCIVPHGAPKKPELEQFIRYNLTTGQKYGAALDFAELPKVVLKAGERAVASL